MQISGAPPLVTVTWGSDTTSTYIRSVPATSSDPNAASYSLGFPPATFTPLSGGGAPPDGRDTNGILSALTAWQQFKQAGGPDYWNSAFSTAIGGYPRGAIVPSATVLGNLWVSTANNNTTDPDTGGAGWNSLFAAGGVLTGTLGAAGFATNPTFSGTLTMAGAGIVSAPGGTIYGQVLETTPTGNLNIGSGTSSIGGALNVTGAIVCGAAIVGTVLGTTATGSLNIGTGNSIIGGPLTVAGPIIGEGNITGGAFITAGPYYSSFYVLVGPTNGNHTPCQSAANGCSISGGQMNAYNSAGSSGQFGTASASDILDFWVGNVGTISIQGKITTSGTGVNYVTTSDYRLKENVRPITDALDRVNATPVYRLNFKADDKKQELSAFLAHEASVHVPRAVFGEKDAVDEEGNPVHQMIDHSQMVPDLWAAVQELSNKLTTALERIKTLESGS